MKSCVCCGEKKRVKFVQGFNLCVNCRNNPFVKITWDNINVGYNRNAQIFILREMKEIWNTKN